VRQCCYLEILLLIPRALFIHRKNFLEKILQRKNFSGGFSRQLRLNKSATAKLSANLE